MTPEERIQAARVLGSISTDKKAAASRENGKKGGRRPGTVLGPQKNRKAIESVACTCGLDTAPMKKSM